MLPSEEFEVIRYTLRFVVITLLRIADEWEKGKKGKLAVELVRGIARSLSKMHIINIYNSARGKSSLAVKGLIETSERNVDLGKGENP